jgi:hypothetical protein
MRDIQRELQEQQMLMQNIMGQLMGGMGGMGLGGMAGQPLSEEMKGSLGNKAQLAAMLGLDPEALDE